MSYLQALAFNFKSQSLVETGQGVVSATKLFFRQQRLFFAPYHEKKALRISLRFFKLTLAGTVLQWPENINEKKKSKKNENNLFSKKSFQRTGEK